jgi:hypothetical protein
MVLFSAKRGHLVQLQILGTAGASPAVFGASPKTPTDRGKVD